MLNTYFFITKTREHRTDNILDNSIKNLSTQYDVMMYNQKLFATEVFKSIMLEKTITDNIQNIDTTNLESLQNKKIRKTLYTHLENKYKNLQELGIFQLQFVLADNRSF